MTEILILKLESYQNVGKIARPSLFTHTHSYTQTK